MGRWEPDAPVAFLWQRWSCSGMAAMSRRLLPTSPRVPVSPRARSFATSPTSAKCSSTGASACSRRCWTVSATRRQTPRPWRGSLPRWVRRPISTLTPIVRSRRVGRRREVRSTLASRPVLAAARRSRTRTRAPRSFTSIAVKVQQAQRRRSRHRRSSSRLLSGRQSGQRRAQTHVGSSNARQWPPAGPDLRHKSDLGYAAFLSGCLRFCSMRKRQCSVNRDG